MPPPSSAWNVWLPIAVVASSTLVLVSAFRRGAGRAPLSRFAAVFAVLVWLSLAGEAALGDQRPVFERQWKGVAAGLLALAGAIHLWQRHRRPDRGSPERLRAPEDVPASAAHPAPRAGHAVLVTMPAFGEDVIEGTVSRWLKKVGDRVRAGEPLVEVSIDKVDAEIPAEASGALREIRIAAGGTAPVGATIAVIEAHAPG